jgi:O-succinylbenzoate synthase
MKLDRIELRVVRLPLVAPFQTSKWVDTCEEHILVTVCGEGLTGWGEVVSAETPWYSSETTKTAWHVLADYIIPDLLKEPHLTGVEDFIARASWVAEHRMAKAGLEAALWDWFAKARGMSLQQMFGGTREKIEVGVSVGIHPTVADLLTRVEGYLSEGYRRVKLKIKPGQDVEYVRVVRSAHPDLRLQVDANSAYRLTDVETFRAMDDLNLLLIEQPLGNGDLFEHAQLQRALKTPICLDESIHSLDDARAALALGSCRVINIKPGRVGGFTETIKIHDYCAAHDIPVWCGGMLESGIGRAGNVAVASLPNFKLPGDLSASKRYYSEDLVAPEFVLNPDGTMDVPRAPGIGVAVILSRVEKYTEQKGEYQG